MRRAPARPVRACFVWSCCCVVVQEHDLRATPVQCNVKQTLSSHFTLHSSHPTLHTSHLHFISTHRHLSSSHLISCLPICQLSSSWLFSFHQSKLSHTQRSFLLREARLHTASFHTQQAFTHRTLYTQCFYTEKPSFTHFVHTKLLHRDAFTHREA